MIGITVKSAGKKMISLLLAVAMLMPLFPITASGAEPSGNNWFQMHANPFTGLDDTGDGSTGNTNDLNYYYIGQTFRGGLEINSVGTSASNIWIDYDSSLMQPTTPATGTYFNSWRNQTVSSNRIKSTGYNFPLSLSTGKGIFGSVQYTMIKPSQANYGTNTPAVLDINTGTIGKTTESNISNNGTDLLNSAEDFRFHIWADTKKPYAKNPNPANAALNVPVNSNYSFDLRDSLRGESSDTGVGTGVNMESSGADILAINGVNSESLKADSTYICTGIWGSNLCSVAINKKPITTYKGDTRKWLYNTQYSIQIIGYKDLASANQNQLGDANGPNIMDNKTFTFTTVADTVAPRLLNIVPAANSVDIGAATTITFDVIDRASYPSGMSGSGINTASCKVDVSSATSPLKTYKSGDAGFAFTSVDYGNSFTVTPIAIFAQGETVTVRIYDCSDIAGNKITESRFTFKTLSLDADGDGILDTVDNCPAAANADQLDTDGDGTGNACDTDMDNDGILNASDNCPIVQNPQQKDSDNDGVGDVCDDDWDNDTVVNTSDNCPLAANPDQKDSDNDGTGDLCDTDMDNDGILNASDNCLLIPNLDQLDTDGDGIGNACDTDMDNDGILNTSDNCPIVVNPTQADMDNDGIGDVCDDDVDNDGIPNAADNCPLIVNADQKDTDKDGLGDACDVPFGNLDITIKAKPQKRAIAINPPNLALNAKLSFYNLITKRIDWEDMVSLDKNGTVLYKTDKVAIGDYDISLKGESHLNKITRTVGIGSNTRTLSLDYTFENTYELIAGDVYSDNLVNSFDIATMLKTYGIRQTNFADLNKDGAVNAMDIALLIINYFKKGESF